MKRSTILLALVLGSAIAVLGCGDTDDGTGGTGGSGSGFAFDSSSTYSFGNFGDNGFVEFITLQAGDVLEFGTCMAKLPKADNRGNDTAIRLLQDSNGSELGSNDDDCNGSPASYLRIAIPANGRYTMRVDCIDGADPCTGVLAYRFTR